MNATVSMTNKLRGTVSMANSKINGGASPYPKGASGSIITITDGAENTPLKSAVVNIEPVQSGSGDPSPTNIRPISGWTQVNVKAAGANLLPLRSGSITQNGQTFTPSNGTLVINGTATANSALYLKDSTIEGNKVYLPAGMYEVSGFEDYNDVNTYVGVNVNSTSGAYTATSKSGNHTFTVEAGDYVFPRARIASGAVMNNYVLKPMIKRTSDASAFAPYQGTPITIPLGRTVYGGTLDVVRGKLNAKPYYASYSGQTLVGPWISSHDKYVAGATPTTGAQVVDMGAAGTEYDLTPQTIKTLLGINNIWADAGEMSIEYYPAAASIVAVQNRSTKMYVSIPLGMIRYETYQITPQQTIDLDSYRSENGNLLRNPVATKCKLEFNTPLMTDTQWGEIWNIIKAGFNNNTERKLKLRYYDTLSATYKTGYFYVPDVQTTIRNIEEGAGVINYNEIRIAFIEY